MNIIDYLKWRGDLSFKASPFNEVDNLVISYVAYTPIDPYIKDGETYTVRQLSDMYMADHSEAEIRKNPSFIAMAPLVLREMAATERFGDCPVHDFVSKINDEKTEQFCALEMDLSDGTTYIAFRGTDDTLLGWHEDFCMSYEIIEAQKSAQKYLKERMKAGRKYRVGGHSKGGNLAIYAVLNCPDKLRNIINVYSNDGPGINTSLLDDEHLKKLAELGDKYVKIVPELDVVGTIYGHKEKKRIIVSDADTILSHDAMTWQVEGNHFIKGKAHKDTTAMSKGFRDFLRDTSFEQRKMLTKELFEAFDEARIKTIGDFARGGIPVFFTALMKFGEMDKESKKVANKLVDSFLYEYRRNLIDQTKDSIAEEKERLENEVTNAIQKAGYDIMDLIMKSTAARNKKDKEKEKKKNKEKK